MTDNTMSAVSFVRNETTQKRINQLIGSRAPQLTTSLITVLNNNDKLAACKPETVLNAALTAASMDLPINQNLGFAYIVPYGNEAQFQMGYKGFIQLAQRSGQFKTINTCYVYEGDEDEDVKKRLTSIIAPNPPSDKVIGYVAYFELLNGFTKSLFMTTEQIEAHALEYSKSYAYDKAKKKQSSNWTTNFDAMALKTVLKLLISKYGPQNTQLQEAITKDQAVIDDDQIVYIDNDSNLPKLSTKERNMQRSISWLSKRFTDEGYDTETARKAFIKKVTGKETLETEEDVELVTEQLNNESTTYVDPAEKYARDDQLKED